MDARLVRFLWFSDQYACDIGRELLRIQREIELAEILTRSFSAGEVIYSEGGTPNAMYVIQSGEVELKVSGKSLGVVGPDGFFGEMALVDQSPRGATTVAKTDCPIMPISEKHFLFMVEETPFFALTVMRTMIARLRQLYVLKQ